jgi:hypothetical protein
VWGADVVAGPQRQCEVAGGDRAAIARARPATGRRLSGT